ncbi:Complex I intermediate-associated protein 84, mitochondrial [Tolypocladium ophioglossoides CBS 100239]|uniref:Complex I intermediate-associated protein 84, mitochondrial n=1 Tax=Tolypocladium ophioglossoides (strain CBS 100239) TaxID=1163406 RepID=A0A0L0MX52_TOLOC|nr:Complex I intermediate-associated protein 84, mitochondrial [Tolypocladium ophioglossoides CBS 100239]
MRANLARHGRRLLVCRASAPSCAAYANPARRRPIARPVARRDFQRTFFNALFQKPPREVRQPEYEPGWMQIMIWRSRMLDSLRPPPRRELVEAWKKLMQSKLKRRVPLNSTQALQCRRLLEYLAEPSNPEQQVKPLSSADLSMARQVLLDIEPQERDQNHLDLAKALHAVWSSGNFTGKSRSLELQWSYFVKSLCRYGGSLEAMQELYSKWNDPVYAAYMDKEDRLVEAVARGLAREGRESELVELVEYAEQHSVPYDAGTQAVMVVFFAERDRVPETQHWLGKPITQSYCQVEVYRAVASFAMRNGLQDWAVPLFIELGQSQPKKKYWDVLSQAILLVGKGLGEVDTMMSHMVDRNGELSPDIHTLNGLLRVAVETKDATLGEEVLALGAAKGLAPNGETYLVLLQMRLATSNVAGAQAAYEQVKYLEPWNNESRLGLFDEYRQLLSQYLVFLSRQSPPDFKLILALLEAVEEEQILLDPETVASLCLRFLENDQHFEVMDILSVHSFLFSEAQREVVQNAFITFCLDRHTSTSRAWGGYQLLHQFFQDTSFERRSRLMEAFFDRKRPDMASHVFGHMRQHRNKSYHPKMDTYIRCLEGFARYPDPEGLGMVHNMLKMDTTIQPTTKLYTAMMLAYTACDKPLAALDFWNEITQSRDGPSYASLEAVFWTLERKPGGDRKAREIWERIERMDLELPPAVYNAYIGAVAGSGNEKEVRSLIVNMASFVGTEPDAMTLAVAHNALPGQELQAGFREWAKKKYRNTWAELDKVGRRLNEYSLCQFKINRVMKA